MRSPVLPQSTCLGRLSSSLLSCPRRRMLLIHHFCNSHRQIPAAQPHERSLDSDVLAVQFDHYSHPVCDRLVFQIVFFCLFHLSTPLPFGLIRLEPVSFFSPSRSFRRCLATPPMDCATLRSIWSFGHSSPHCKNAHLLASNVSSAA